MNRFFRKLITLAAVALTVLLTTRAARSQDFHPSTIAFLNRSGQTAVVRLVGPSAQRVSVPNQSARVVHVVPGKYHIVVRYGDVPLKFSYVEGASFSVGQSAGHYSEMSITLHRVVNGNYATHPANVADFGR